MKFDPPSRRNLGAEASSELREAHTTAAQHARRIGELDQERAAMKTSRSWRWTAWLRALERNRRGP
jgi:hypothetical protein